MSFYTSLSGLKAAQTNLSVVSNNVANVGSTGFKKSRADFGDIMSASPFQSANMAGNGTRLQNIDQEFSQGGIQTSERGLDLMISGQGFFVTHQEQSGGQTSFTRNGAFGTDKDNNVIDSRGAFLQVLPVDATGAVTATGLSATRNLTIPQTSGSARATEKVTQTVNLPADATVPSSRAQYANGYAFDRLDPNSYNFSATSTVYDTAGTAFQATTYYSRDTAPTDTDRSSSWSARTFVGDTELSADGNATVPAVAARLTFDGDGRITAPTAAIKYGAATPKGAAGPLNLSVDFGTATRQSAAAFSTTNLTQDGMPVGKLDNVSIGKDGLVTATYSNGDDQNLGKLVIATFANPAGMRQLGDAAWTQTGESGAAIVGEAGAGGLGSISSGQLETANVDITEELVALITAQRNFQANAKAIDTANQMTSIAVNLRSS
jgi:flagellar hook protein FlgE